jgi:hypothetical protein
VDNQLCERKYIGVGLDAFLDQFFDSGARLGEKVADSLRYLFPAGIIMFDTWWQIKTIPLDDIKNMIARDVAFVSTDVDR